MSYLDRSILIISFIHLVAPKGAVGFCTSKKRFTPVHHEFGGRAGCLSA